MKKEIIKHLAAPVLASVFPPVFLYQVNIYEVPAISFSIILTAAVCFSALLFVLMSVITKRVVVSSIATSFLVAAFYLFGAAYDAIDSTSIHGLFSSQLIALVLYILICAVGCLMIFRYKDKGSLQIILWYVNTFLLLLICINIVVVGYKLVYPGKAGHTDRTVFAAGPSAGAKGDLPDIYYIVLDEYAGSETVKNYYDYDNAGFEGFLEKKGFFISRSSVSRYDSTEFALAAVLNFTSIDPSTPGRQLYGLISGSSVSAYLKSLGYSYIHIGSPMEVNKIEVKLADRYFNYFNEKRFYMEDRFSSKIIDMSVLRPFFYTMNWTKVQQDGVRYSFDKLGELIGEGGPKYVYAHIMCPHHPFVFDSSGGPLKIADRKNWKDKGIYLGQYIFISKMVANFVEKLMTESEKKGSKPVVIIQSDHGPRKVPGAPSDERYKIFNAMHLPYGGNEKLYEGISPVNTFPVIFNTYFGDNLKLVSEDK